MATESDALRARVMRLEQALRDIASLGDAESIHYAGMMGYVGARGKECARIARGALAAERGQ